MSQTEYLEFNDKAFLEAFDFSLFKPGQCWRMAFSGLEDRSAFYQLLEERSIIEGLIPRCELADGKSLRFLNFSEQQKLLERILENDDSDFVEGGIAEGFTVKDLFEAFHPRDFEAARQEEFLEAFNLKAFYRRGLKFLSTGEMLKALLAALLALDKQVLLLDGIFDGIDQAARKVLEDYGCRLKESSRSQCLVIIDWPPSANNSSFFTHLVNINKGQFAIHDLSSSDASKDPAIYSPEPSGEKAEAFLAARNIPSMAGIYKLPSPVLIELNNLHISWDDRDVIKNFNWKVEKGEHTFIQGPNGCGKSSLLRIISGDNPQVYVNDVHICGIKRGQGESIWDIKSKVITVSQKFHFDYLYHGFYSLEEVLLSAFDDSIGLYRPAKDSEKPLLGQWLDLLGLKADQIFSQLSWGMQRLLLICRAMVQFHPIVIMDEPCQGLESPWRERALELLDLLASQSEATILHVSHDSDECLPSYTSRLDWNAETLAFDKSAVKA